MISLPVFLNVLAAAAVTAAANFLLRSGILAAGFNPKTAIEVIPAFAGLLLNPLFAAGFILYFVAALIWFRAIAIAPLSVAYPVLVSLTFIMVTIGASIIWAEEITARKIAGLLTIIVGIALAAG